jgi:hypothetical protein
VSLNTYTKSLTKFQKAKIIISTLYNMNYVCTSLNKVQWREVKAVSRNKTEHIEARYLLALKILCDRGIKEGKDIITEWVKQSIEGEQL